MHIFLDMKKIPLNIIVNLLIMLCLVIFNPYDGIAQTPDAIRKQSILNSIPQSLRNRLAADEPQEVIVEFDSKGVEAEATALRLQRRLAYDDHNIIQLKAQRFRQIKNKAWARVPALEADILIDYTHLPMALLRIRSWSALMQILDLPEVAAVYENTTIYPHLAQSLPLISQPQAASAGYKGAGTTVAVLDTGVNYTLAAFGACTAPGNPSGCKVAAAVEIAENDGSLDDSGHGTNVSAIVLGVAPDSGIAAVDVFNPDGSSTDALVISGINWAIANKAAYNIIAVNMSLGDSTRRTSPCVAPNPYLTPVNNAIAAGIQPVASSGNNGYTDGISRPACTPGIISVGAVYDANIGGISYGVCTDATTAADKVICFSNSASFLTMLAPGAAITAGGYTKYGTSQAAPHVAGAVAVLRAAYPSESNDAITGRLTSTGQQVTDPRNSIQKPRFNLLGALAITPPVAPVALAAASVTTTGFTANWSAVTGANGYRFDVSTDSGFGNFVTGYNNKDAGPATSSDVIGLSPGTQHYYRVRAYNAGGMSGNSNTISIRLLANLSVAVTGSGTVTSNPSGISCINGSGMCEASFDGGTVVALTPEASTGYVFSEWLGDYTGTGTCVITMDADKAVTALFARQAFTITATVDVGGDGSIVPPGSVVAYGDSITLTITPDSGYALNTLTDNGAPVTATPGPSGTFTYTIMNVTANHDVAAAFSPLSAYPVPALNLTGLLLLTGGLLIIGMRKIYA